MKAGSLICFLVIVSVAICLYGCGGSNTRKMLLKKWQVESIVSVDIDKDIAKLKQVMDTAKDSATRINIFTKIRFDYAIIEAYKTMIVEYKADSTFVKSISLGSESRTKTGRWMLSEDNKKIIVIDEKLNKDTDDIVEITPDRFVTVSSDNAVCMTYKAVK